jgi:hypothetical protein
MSDQVNDPILAAMQRQVAGLDTMMKRIDELEALLKQLFARLRQIEAEHARLIETSPPLPPPSLN